MDFPQNREEAREIDSCGRTYQALYNDCRRWQLSLERRTRALRKVGTRLKNERWVTRALKRAIAENTQEIERLKKQLAAYECELRDYARTVTELRKEAV